MTIINDIYKQISMSLQPGLVLNNRYVIIKELGRSRNITYLAKDTQVNNKLRAIKKIEPSPNLSSKEMRSKIRDMFEGEGASLQLLGQHPQIPQLFDRFEENNKFYLVQEYIEGNNLNKKEIVAGKKLNESKTIELLKDICQILDVVHKNNLIHRDIKPSNLIRRNDGKLILIDFGSAKKISSIEERSRSAMIFGTPGYMPREQMMGEPKKCSDIYAVGIIAIQALTGYKVTEILDRQQNDYDYLVWNYSLYGREKLKVSPQLEFILNKMTCRKSELRYQSAQEVLEDLANYASHSLSLKQQKEENIFIKISAIVISLLIGFTIGKFYSYAVNSNEITNRSPSKIPLHQPIK